MGNSQSRKWNITINNPETVGLNHKAIVEKLKLFCPRYYCLADEIATTGTPHTHIFLLSDSPIRFSTIKNRLPVAHIERAYGSAQDNRDYVRKGGKWADSDKAETVVAGTFQEWGDMPSEKAEKAPLMVQVIEDIKNGKTTAQIIEDNPALAFRVSDIDKLRQTLLADKYMRENREVEVTYIYGATGAGKTRSIFEKHSPMDVCRITNYGSKRGINFDGYSAQPVLVFEEFASQIPVEDMLSYLDIYPVYLPARYSDRVACYTQVYITSNIPLEQQYTDVQWERWETWKAFLRRIGKVVEYKADGSIVTHKKEA